MFIGNNTMGGFEDPEISVLGIWSIKPKLITNPHQEELFLKKETPL